MKLIREVMRKETNTKVVSNTVELKKKKKETSVRIRVRKMTQVDKSSDLSKIAK